MKLRAYQEADLERIKQLYRRQGFKFDFPDLGDPVFAISSVAENGEAQAAAFLKITAEAYLFLNPEYADPLTRWQTLLQVHEDVRRQAKEIGLQDVNLWAPPELFKDGQPKGFLRRLGKLGWTINAWTNLSYRLR